MKRMIVFAVIAVSGCQQAVKAPEKVYVTVEKYRPLPDWATAPVPNKPPSAATVEALRVANDARAGTIDLVNCRSRLLVKVDQGLKVDPKECGL